MLRLALMPVLKHARGGTPGAQFQRKFQRLATDELSSVGNRHF